MAVVDTIATSLRGALMRWVDDPPVVFELLDLASILVDCPVDLALVDDRGRRFANYVGDEQRHGRQAATVRRVSLPRTETAGLLAFEAASDDVTNLAQAVSGIEALFGRLESQTELWKRIRNGFEALMRANPAEVLPPRFGAAALPPSTLELGLTLWRGVLRPAVDSLSPFGIPFTFFVRVGDGGLWSLYSWDGSTPTDTGSIGLEFEGIGEESVPLAVVRAFSSGVLQIDRVKGSVPTSTERLDATRAAYVPVHYSGAPWALLRVEVPGQDAGLERLHDFYRFSPVMGRVRDAIRATLKAVLNGRLDKFRSQLAGDPRDVLERIWEGVPQVLPLPTPHLSRSTSVDSSRTRHRIEGERYDTELTWETPFLREGWRLPRGREGTRSSSELEGTAPLTGSYALEDIEKEYVEPFKALVDAFVAERRAGEISQLAAQNARERALAHTFKSVSGAVSSRIPHPSKVSASDPMHEELGLARAAAQYMRLVFSWRQVTQPEELKSFDPWAAQRIDLDLGAFLEGQLVPVELLHVAQLQGMVDGALLSAASSFVRSAASRLCENVSWIGPADTGAFLWGPHLPLPSARVSAAQTDIGARSHGSAQFLKAVSAAGGGPQPVFEGTEGLIIRLPRSKSGLALVLLAFYELLYNALSHYKRKDARLLRVEKVGPHLVLSEGHWRGDPDQLERGMETVESFCLRKHRSRFGLRSIVHVLERSGVELQVLETEDDFVRVFRHADKSPLFGGWT